jgi:hypothetical protein
VDEGSCLFEEIWGESASQRLLPVGCCRVAKGRTFGSQSEQNRTVIVFGGGERRGEAGRCKVRSGMGFASSSGVVAANFYGESCGDFASSFPVWGS